MLLVRAGEYLLRHYNSASRHSVAGRKGLSLSLIQPYTRLPERRLSSQGKFVPITKRNLPDVLPHVGRMMSMSPHLRSQAIPRVEWHSVVPPANNYWVNRTRNGQPAFLGVAQRNAGCTAVRGVGSLCRSAKISARRHGGTALDFCNCATLFVAVTETVLGGKTPYRALGITD
jgi:hypothetical protein